MKGEPARYLGRIVSKEHFRAFIYGADGQKKLVESWDSFEAHMQTGLWFASKHDAESIAQAADVAVLVHEKKEKIKRSVRKKEIEEPVNAPEVDVLHANTETDNLVVEAKDDFLPRE